MQYISGENLKEGALSFIQSSETLTLFSAYLKLEELKRINNEYKIKRIIVRWEIQDLCLRVSDLEVFDYCKENEIILYRNTRLHLKVFWDNKNRIFFGSANVTNRGLGESGLFNYELNGDSNDVSLGTRQYLNKIILESEYVSNSLYHKIKELVNEVKEPEVIYPSLKTKKAEEDYFLLSDLPMSRSVESLFNIYSLREDIMDEEEINSAAHDLALYQIKPDLDKAEFEQELCKNFNSHPFINKLKEKIAHEKSMRYGGVVRWIQENTTSVPIPRSWDIKKELIVNILYDWICHFDNKYTWNVPGQRSQVIHFKDE